MPYSAKDSFLLQLPPKEAYCRVLVSAVEEVGVLFGLSAARTGSLRETTARVFSCLCKASVPDGLVVEFRPGGSTVQVVFTFSTDPADLSGLEEVMAESAKQYTDFESVASVSFGGVDVFHILRSGGLEVQIVLGQEKEYPVVHHSGGKLPAPVPPFEIVGDPRADEILATCLAAQGFYSQNLLHKSLSQPLKVVDMVEAGEMSVCLALDRGRRPAGMICWQAAGNNHAIFFGPYVFVREQGAAGQSLARDITESFLARVSRSGLSGVFSGLATAELPVEGFEELGTILYSLDAESYLPITTYYRHLREDPGGVVWAHPAIADYLRSCYERSAFVREVCLTPLRVNSISSRTVIFAEIRRELREAVLRPLSAGPDAGETVLRHVKNLKRRGVCNLFFHVDLAFAWQARLAPALLDNGFRPALLLPCAGTSDLLIFHYEETSTP